VVTFGKAYLVSGKRGENRQRKGCRSEIYIKFKIIIFKEIKVKYIFPN